MLGEPRPITHPVKFFEKGDKPLEIVTTRQWYIRNGGRDEDLRNLTRVLGDAFDNIVLFEDACQRGRADGEVIALLREGLEGARRATHVEALRGEFIAIDRGLEILKPGDQCLVLVDQVEEALDHLQKRIREG